MSIEGNSQKDLALNDEDAENIVGGKSKKAVKKTQVKATSPSAAAQASVAYPRPSTQTADAAVDPGAETSDEC